MKSIVDQMLEPTSNSTTVRSTTWRSATRTAAVNAALDEFVRLPKRRQLMALCGLLQMPTLPVAIRTAAPLRGRRVQLSSSTKRTRRVTPQVSS